MNIHIKLGYRQSAELESLFYYYLYKMDENNVSLNFNLETGYENTLSLIVTKQELNNHPFLVQRIKENLELIGFEVLKIFEVEFSENDMFRFSFQLTSESIAIIKIMQFDNEVVLRIGNENNHI